MLRMQPPDLAVPVGPGDHTLDRDDAPVTLLEYADYECPCCRMTQPAIFAGGNASGVEGRPQSFLNGYRYDGEAGYEPLRETIDDALAYGMRG